VAKELCKRGLQEIKYSIFQDYDSKKIKMLTFVFPEGIEAPDKNCYQWKKHKKHSITLPPKYSQLTFFTGKESNHADADRYLFKI
jgi:hypothetical protein